MSRIVTLMYVLGYLGLLTRQVMCKEFSQCYNDVGICLWTNGIKRTKYEARSDCRERDYYLLSIINSDIQSKLAEFRAAAPQHLLGSNQFWTDFRASGASKFSWIDGNVFSG